MSEKMILHIAVAMAAIVAYVFMQDGDVVQQIVYVGSAFLATASAIQVTLLFGRKSQHFLTFLGLACGFGSLFIGEVLWTYLDSYTAIPPFPSVADVFYIVSYFFFIFALIREIRLKNVMVMAFTPIVNCFIILFSSLLGACVLYFGIFLAYDSALSLFENGLLISYGVFDLVLIVFVISLLRLALLFKKGKLAEFWLWIALSLLLLLIADILLAVFSSEYLSKMSFYRQIDIFWIGGYLCASLGFQKMVLFLRDVRDRVSRPQSKGLSESTQLREPSGYVSKRLSFGVVMGGILAFFMGLVVWLLWIVPWTTQLTDNFYYSANLISQDNFFDQEKKEYRGEQFSTSQFYYEVESATPNILILRNVFDVRDISGAKIFSVTRKYGINRKTMRHVALFGDRDRSGFLFGPQLWSPKEFEYWHANYNQPIQLRLQSQETIDGLLVSRYEATFRADQTTELGDLPEVGETKGINLDVNLQVWIEPISGWLVKYTDKATAYYYDLGTGQRLQPWNTFSNTYEESSVQEQVNKARIRKRQILSITVAIPIILTCIILGLGGILLFQKFFFKKKVFYAILLVLLPTSILSITMASWWFASVVVNERIISRFQTEAESTELAVFKRIEIYKNVLEASRAFFTGSQSVEREEWAAYVKAVNVQTNYPGVQGIGYAPYLTPAEKQSLIEKVRNEGFSDFKIFPESDRSVYSTVLYLEPFDERNQRAFGYDMLTDKVRRRAMEQARDYNLPTISDEVSLLQEGEQSEKGGFLMYLPVYKTGTQTETVQQRRSALQGYVYMPFQTESFMVGLFGDNFPKSNFRIYHGTRTDLPEQIMFESHISFNQRQLVRKKTFFILGHPWTFHFEADSEAYLEPVERLIQPFFLVTGTLMTVLTFGFLLSLVTSQTRAEDYARKITVDLQRYAENLSNAQDIAQLGSWEWNVKTKELIWSDLSYEIFGKDKATFTPTYEKYLSLIHPEDLSKVRSVIEKALTDHRPFEFYHRILLADKSIKIAHCHGQVQLDENGEPAKMVGVVQDVTREKKAAEELERRTQELSKLNKMMIGRELKMQELKKKIGGIHPAGVSEIKIEQKAQAAVNKVQSTPDKKEPGESTKSFYENI